VRSRAMARNHSSSTQKSKSSDHLVESFFCKLNKVIRIATRRDKTDQSFATMIYLFVINSGSINRPSVDFNPQRRHPRCSGAEPRLPVAY
jgi:hypothetical protein